MTITRETLKQYDHLAKELTEQRTRICQLERHAAIEPQLCSSDELDKQKTELAQLETMVVQQRTAIEQFIKQIPDSIARRAMRMRYVDRKTWLSIALSLGYSDESSARMLCERQMARQRRAGHEPKEN